MAGNDLPPLPDGFLFGVATSDHQCEAYDPDRPDIHDVWERAEGRTPRGRATDFWNRYAEDIAHAASLGCKLFRFSIAWARVEPAPGQYDEVAFAHYRDLLRAVKAAGMEPLVTLLHFTWPVHVEQRGGLTSEEFPELFRAYAAQVARRLGAEARHWVTLNEPNQLAFGFIKPWWEGRYFLPPGLPAGASSRDQLLAVGRLMRNLFSAHALARDELHRANRDAQVGANPMLLGLPGWLQRLVDWSATRSGALEAFLSRGRRFAARRALGGGRADVVLANFSPTEDRARQVAFSEPYFEAALRLLAPRRAGPPAVEALEGRPVAVVAGTIAEECARRLLPRARILVFETNAAAVAALEREAAAYLADDAILGSVCRMFPDRYAMGPPLERAPYAAAVPHGDPSLLGAVDAAVRGFRDSGEWRRSCERHLERAPTPPARGPGTESLGPLPQIRGGEGPLLKRIRRRGYVRVAVKEDVRGFGHRGPGGDWTGLEVDLGHWIAQVIFGDRTRVRFVRTPTRARASRLRSALRVVEPLLKLYAVLSSVVTSNWWHLGMAGKLPEFLCPPECVGAQDFVGLDYYWGIPALRLDRVGRLMDAVAGRYDRAPVWPGVLRQMLRYHAELFPGQPLLVVENGCVDRTDGHDRAAYLQQHVAEVQRAVAEGAPVRAYVCWSITSNREWGQPFGRGSDFGLFHIALDTDAALARVPTEAAEAYRRIISKRGVG